MRQVRAVFIQLMRFLLNGGFRRVLQRYDGGSRLRGFSSWEESVSMPFTQLNYRENLRGIETCLRAAGPKLYHLTDPAPNGCDVSGIYAC